MVTAPACAASWRVRQEHTGVEPEAVMPTTTSRLCHASCCEIFRALREESSAPSTAWVSARIPPAIIA